MITAAGTETAKGNGKGKRGTKGRLDHGGQEAVTRPSVVVEKIDHLEKLEVKSRDAAKDASDAIKAVAESSGYTAAAIKKLVVARVGDKFKEKLRDAEQQLELFNECGE